MGKLKIRLDTLHDIKTFVDITSKQEGKVVITDGNDQTVNAKSILNVLASVEWAELYCISDEDIYSKIKDFVI